MYGNIKLSDQWIKNPIPFCCWVKKKNALSRRKCIVNFPRSHPNVPLGRFWCNTVTSWWLMTGVIKPCPFPPTPFPSRLWHRSATHVSDVIPPHWGAAAIFSPCKIAQSLQLFPCSDIYAGVSQYVCMRRTETDRCPLGLSSASRTTARVRVVREMLGKTDGRQAQAQERSLVVSTERSGDGSEGRGCGRLDTNFIEWAHGLRSLRNHSHGHRLEELKREIRFHVVKRFFGGGSAAPRSQVLTRRSSSGLG